MQKLVTIYLDNTAYGKPKVSGCYKEKHGLVEEYLQEYLTDGWQVRSLFGLGGSNGLCCQGWFAVVFEKGEGDAQ
jgi:lysophospholipase L1-like esterase